MDIQGIGNQIKAARLEEGLTQEELATKVKTFKNSISDIEKGKRNVGIKLLLKIADALNRNISDNILVPKPQPEQDSK